MRTAARRFGPWLAVLTLFGCGDDDDGPPPIPPLARLELVEPGSTEGALPCVARGDDPDQSITVEVEVRNFTLRPPFSCNELECGTVLLTIDANGQEFSFETAQLETSIPTTDWENGPVTIEAELLDTFGDPYRSRDERRARCTDCTRRFELRDRCGDAPPDAGPSFDAGSDPPPMDAATPRDAGPAAPDAAPPLVDAASPRDAATPDARVPSPSPTDAAVPDAGMDAGTALPDPDAGPSLEDAGDPSRSPDASLLDAGQ